MPAGREMTQPRQERSETSTQRLLDAAIELLAEAGYAGMTLAAVGDRAGYSRGLVTTRFGNKQNLLRALAERLVEVWSPDVVELPADTDGLQRVVALVLVIGERVGSDPTALRALQRLIFERAVGPVDELQRDFALSANDIEVELTASIRRGIRDGSIRRDAVPERTAASVIASLRGISYQWFLHPDAVDMGALHEDLADQLRRSLSTGGAR